MSHRSDSSVRNSSRYPSVCDAGANGWIRPNSGHVIGTISAVALSFMVHEPSEIIECTSDRSRDSSLRMYRSISCSAWNRWNTGCVRKALVRAKRSSYRSSMSSASDATVKVSGAPPLSATRTSLTSASPTVSSSATTTLVPDALRRLIPSLRAAPSTLPAVLPARSMRTVSK